jgi:DNA-binding beta-propeller fold protein YncE
MKFIIYFLLLFSVSTYSYSATKLEVGDAFSEPVIDFKNHRAYISQNLLKGNLLILNLKNNTIEKRVLVSSHPFKPLLSNQYNRLYVVSKSKNVVEILDLNSLKVIDTINLMYQPDGGSIISTKLSRIYVPHDKHGIISVIDMKSNKVATTINIGATINGKLVLVDDESKLLISSHGTGSIYIVDLNLKHE